MTTTATASSSKMVSASAPSTNSARSTAARKRLNGLEAESGKDGRDMAFLIRACLQSVHGREKRGPGRSAACRPPRSALRGQMANGWQTDFLGQMGRGAAIARGAHCL